jgi:hypothetical protein
VALVWPSGTAVLLSVSHNKTIPELITQQGKKQEKKKTSDASRKTIKASAMRLVTIHTADQISWK